MLKEPLRSSGELFYDAPDPGSRSARSPRARNPWCSITASSRRSAGPHRHVLRAVRLPCKSCRSWRASALTLAGAMRPHSSATSASIFAASWRTGRRCTSRRKGSGARAHKVKDITIEGERDVLHSIVIRQSDGDTRARSSRDQDLKSLHEPRRSSGARRSSCSSPSWPPSSPARAHYSADLSAFLPRSPTATQQLLGGAAARGGTRRASHPRGHPVARTPARGGARLDGAWARTAPRIPPSRASVTGRRRRSSAIRAFSIPTPLSPGR